MDHPTTECVIFRMPARIFEGTPFYLIETGLLPLARRPEEKKIISETDLIRANYLFAAQEPEKSGTLLPFSVPYLYCF
jgi:hypothetical protein